MQHNTCPVCRFQLPADPNHHMQPQAGPELPSGGAGLASVAGNGSNVWADIGNLFPGDAAQILGSITAALDGVIGAGRVSVVIVFLYFYRCPHEHPALRPYAWCTILRLLRLLLTGVWSSPCRPTGPGGQGAASPGGRGSPRTCPGGCCTVRGWAAGARECCWRQGPSPPCCHAGSAGQSR
jgi:hypothetical protein